MCLWFTVAQQEKKLFNGVYMAAGLSLHLDISLENQSTIWLAKLRFLTPLVAFNCLTETLYPMQETFKTFAP